MNRFHHLLIADAHGQALVGICIDAIRTMAYGCHRKGDQRLLAFREFAWTSRLPIVFEEPLSQFGGVLSDIGEIR